MNVGFANDVTTAADGKDGTENILRVECEVIEVIKSQYINH